MQLPQARKLVASFDAFKPMREDRDAKSHEQQPAKEKFDAAGVTEEMSGGISCPDLLPTHGDNPFLAFQACFE